MSGDPSNSSSPAESGPLGEGAGRRVDARVVEQWYSQQVEWLRVFVFGILRDNHQVADVLQTVFRKALESGASIEPQSVRAWFTRVAHNEALLLKRKQGVVSRGLARLGASESEVDSAELPLEGLLRRETAELVREAVQRLPAEQRFVVERRIDSDQTFAEIAAELGVPLGTVLTRMRLALGKLRLALRSESLNAESHEPENREADE